MKITIASGKGGTGKTTLSVNLAAYLADHKKDVVLIDLDVEEPNSNLFLQGDCKQSKIANKAVPKWESDDCTYCGECADICNFNAIVALSNEIIVHPELCHSCYACSELCPTHSLPMENERIGEIKLFESKGFDLIEGRLDLGQEMAVGLIAQTITFANSHYEKYMKIFDAPPGTSCPVIEATKESHLVLLVTEPTPFGLNDLILAVETMKVLDKKMGVIINRYGIGDDAVEKYCKKENIPVIAKIKNDKTIAKYYANGELIYNQVEHFKESIKQVVDYIEECR